MHVGFFISAFRGVYFIFCCIFSWPVFMRRWKETFMSLEQQLWKTGTLKEQLESCVIVASVNALQVLGPVREVKNGNN